MNNFFFFFGGGGGGRGGIRPCKGVFLGSEILAGCFG